MHPFSISRLILGLTLACAQLPLLGAAADRRADMPQPRPVTVVELFTSEGCSSCPPADALLQKIHLKQSEWGQLIVGISEHVAYWDLLGWKDPFAAEVFTERQAAYAARLSHDGPYTPQMVVNGRDQFVGSDTGALAKALRANAGGPHLNVEISSADIAQSVLNLQFSLQGAPSAPLDIVAVLTDDADRSNVLRGENSGKALQHISVARMLVRVATVGDGNEHSIHLKLPKALALGAGTGHHLILLAQEPHQGAILGAAQRPI